MRIHRRSQPARWQCWPENISYRSAGAASQIAQWAGDGNDDGDDEPSGGCGRCWAEPSYPLRSSSLCLQLCLRSIPQPARGRKGFLAEIVCGQAPACQCEGIPLSLRGREVPEAISRFSGTAYLKGVTSPPSLGEGQPRNRLRHCSPSFRVGMGKRCEDIQTTQKIAWFLCVLWLFVAIKASQQAMTAPPTPLLPSPLATHAPTHLGEWQRSGCLANQYSLLQVLGPLPGGCR